MKEISWKMQETFQVRLLVNFCAKSTKMEPNLAITSITTQMREIANFFRHQVGLVI